MRTVILSSSKVEILDRLTWGMQEEIRSAMLGGIKMHGLTDAQRGDIELNPSALMAAKYRALELCVVKVVSSDGSESAYSREWMNALSIEDGDTLLEAVNDVTSPKKK